MFVLFFLSMLWVTKNVSSHPISNPIHFYTELRRGFWPISIALEIGCDKEQPEHRREEKYKPVFARNCTMHNYILT
jgi:hypothetical protein